MKSASCVASSKGGSVRHHCLRQKVEEKFGILLWKKKSTQGPDVHRIVLMGFFKKKKLNFRPVRAS